MRLVEFKPLAPPSFHSTSIGGFEVFGIARALPLPLPTTVAGALGSYLGVRLDGKGPIDALAELYEALGSKLGCSNLSCIRGPITYFEIRGRRYGPYVCIEDLFTPLTALSVGSTGSVCVEEVEEVVRWEPRIRVGVALERRGIGGAKRVMPGYFFKYSVSTYRLGSEVVKPIFTYMIPLTTDLNTVLRFGGEGSVAKVVSRGVEYLGEVVKNVVSPLEDLEEGYYVALSPVPLLPRKPEPAKLWEDLEVPLNLEYSEILGLPRKCPNLRGEVAQPPKLRIVRLGLGFSEASRRRRPQILALPPGTVIRVHRKHRPDTSQLLKALLGLGFATLYKL